MASRISQMRNGYQTQAPMSQQSLDISIQQTRNLMQQMKNSQNSQALLAQALENNPNTAAIASMLNGGNNLEGIARMIAQNKGYDINEVIQKLGGI